jgi:NAD(P)-dependent dehydrogenase (short-subunit alcohol dehydrogenase family)
MNLVNTLRRLLVHPTLAEALPLRGRRAIVTGTSPGSLGFETARILAEWGASVTVTTRSRTDDVARAIAAAAGGADIVGHALDLSDAGSVKAFLGWYRREQGESLDILVNNAGIHLDLLSKWKQPRLSEDGFEIQWRTNFLGTFHLTYLLMPLLKKANDARVVNVVSALHDRGSNEGLFNPSYKPYNSWRSYGLSKLALVHTTTEIQRRFAAVDQVQCYCLHPGAVYTNVAGKGLANTGLIEKVRKALAPVEAFFLMTPEEGAQTQVYCATAPAAEGGLYYRNCKPAKPSTDAKDRAVAACLWDQTEAWVQQL